MDCFGRAITHPSRTAGGCSFLGARWGVELPKPEGALFKVHSGFAFKAHSEKMQGALACRFRTVKIELPWTCQSRKNPSSLTLVAGAEILDLMPNTVGLNLPLSGAASTGLGDSEDHLFRLVKQAPTQYKPYPPSTVCPTIRTLNPKAQTPRVQASSNQIYSPQ